MVSPVAFSLLSSSALPDTYGVFVDFLLQVEVLLYLCKEDLFNHSLTNGFSLLEMER